MISVAMCTFNGEKYVAEQINSIIAQTKSVDEIVVCDDGSTDGTLEIVSEIADNTDLKIKIYKNERNLGVTKNFEKALSMCEGDIIFLSDQDDIWTPNKVEEIVSVFEQDPETLLIFSDAVLVDAQGRNLGVSLWERINITPKEEYHVQDFLGKRFVTGATVAVRRSLLVTTLPIPACWIHDAWLAINASVNGNVVAINKRLVSYRQHEKNVIGAQKRPLIQQIKYTSEHINRSIAFRTTMRKRMESFLKLNKDKMSLDEKKAVIKCIDFWRRAELLGQMNISVGFANILVNMCNKGYIKYNNGLKGAAVDFFILIRSHYRIRKGSTAL